MLVSEVNLRMLTGKLSGRIMLMQLVGTRQVTHTGRSCKPATLSSTSWFVTREAVRGFTKHENMGESTSKTQVWIVELVDGNILSRRLNPRVD